MGFNFPDSNFPGSKEGAGIDEEQKTKEPPFYKVVLLNDDYTTMDFVVKILEDVFHKSASDATRIMLDVHKKGSGVCGIYIRDIAETKVLTVNTLSQDNGFPLKCVMEEE
jgi:ATP-dependent Clp protease adaptor protein ClpS